MSQLGIETEGRRSTFAPGDVIRGTVDWQLDGPPNRVDLRLFWYTEGKGDSDLGVVAVENFEQPGQRDRRSFSLQVPEGPLSFSGTLISLLWAIELVAAPGGEVARLNLLVSYSGREIRLSKVTLPEEADAEAKAEKLKGRFSSLKRSK
ncbi:MAG TPA: hypothetical protein PK413_04165 [Thermoanaerobaculia bacterium]|nr:hypothetical protein [Thermoanaerobaculia bacterium]